jgi:hypothetical protein
MVFVNILRAPLYLKTLNSYCYNLLLKVKTKHNEKQIVSIIFIFSRLLGKKVHPIVVGCIANSFESIQVLLEKGVDVN